MHSQSITHCPPDPKPMPMLLDAPSLLRFQHYLMAHGRPWGEADQWRWQEIQASHPTAANEQALLHGWIVDALNSQRIALDVVSAWLMQYPAGQMVVASRWQSAPHAQMGLLYPDWSRMQHIKSALGLPWYNGWA